MMRRAGRCALLAGLSLALSAAAAPLDLRAIEAGLGEAERAMMADPDQALSAARLGLKRLGTLPASDRAAVVRARARWLEGEALGRLNEIDAADASLRTALADVEKVAPGTQLHGRILMSRGAVELDRGKVQRAFLAYRRAYDMFRRANDPRDQALALQNIGSIYSDAGDQQSVLRYYAQSADLFPADAGLAVSARNNLGLAYKEMGNLPRAEAEYRLALSLADGLHSPLLEARILNNIGAVLLARGRLQAADRSADRALALAQTGAAAEWAPFLWGLKAQVAFQRGDTRAAVALFDRTFQGADLEKTNFYFRDFHEAAVDAYLAVGNKEAALLHLRAFKRLDDDAREIRSSTNAALSAAQFDFSNQELRISKLQAGQLQRDVALGRARERLNALMLAAALLLLAATAAGFFSVRHSRNQTRVANKRLEASNQSLDKALKAKSEFLATTSHEIRTPLNGILGMAQVLLSGRSLDGEDREKVGLIRAAGTTMKAIVDDILDMAKIEAGRVEVQSSPFSLPALLTEIGALWHAEAQSKGVAVTLDLARAPARIIADERKVRQLVFNLLSNAVKFTEAGSIDLSVDTAVVDAAEELRIIVRDTGVGIPPEQLEAVFEAFHQVEGGTTRKVGGTGLGLAICSNLAAAMGGRVTVCSVLGEGSIFTVAMPLERDETTVAMSAATAAPQRLAEASVLVVEGNALLRSILAASLEPHVARVTVAADLAEASAEALGTPPHLLVVDLATLLEEADSTDALRAWGERCPAVPVLLLSGPDEAAANALVAAGIAAWSLRKTLPQMGLSAALSSLLGEAQGRAALAA